MGQRSNSEDRAPLAPPLPRPGSKQEEDEDDQQSASQAPEEHTVPELMEEVADKLDKILDEAKQLLQQLRDM